MLDIKKIRENPDFFRTALKNRGGRYLPNLEGLLGVDAEHLKNLKDLEALRAKHNQISKQIGAFKAKGQAIDSLLLKEAEEIKNKIDSLYGTVEALNKKAEDLLCFLPNVPDESAPLGKGPEDNKTIFEWTPNGRTLDLGFPCKDHKDLGETLGVLNFEGASRLAGNRFALLIGKGAALERALISFMLDAHTKEFGYTEIFPPFIVNEKTAWGTGHLPFFKEDLYKIEGAPEYLLPTAEVALVNLHREQTLKEEALPKAYVAYTACFRQEAGSFGKDVRGLIRNHQFNKVELVRFSLPEKSFEELGLLRSHAEEILRRLKLPYRVVELCTADLGTASTKTYDLEVWMPGEKRWREISSISNCADFQSRRLQTRVVRKDGKKEFLHTLNGSGLAVGRTFAALLENYQKPDGHVVIPDALKNYLHFQEI